MASDTEGFDEAKKIAESRKKVSEFFAEERKKWREPGAGKSLFNVNFSIKNRNILGILNSLELECIEMAQNPSVDPGKVIEWARRQIAKEAD
ncbi:MAG: hypothetical protein V1820_03325 [archaeon]